MGLERIYSKKDYQVLKAEISAGKRMPVHYATSEAFVIVVKGSAELIFSDRQEMLKAGMQMSIPERKAHTLKILSDFEAFIVIGGPASMQFTGGTRESKAFAAEL